MPARFTDAPPGSGRLVPRLVLGHARGMLRARFGRISGAAFVFFVPPALLFFAADAVRTAHDDAGGSTKIALLAALIVTASVGRFMGAIFFAGFLDLAIGDDYFRGERRTLGEVLRELPWWPLLVVDVVVNLAAGVGAALFVVPGILVYTFFGLVGPVVVQERHGPWNALRRTARMTRPHWLMVLGLVVIPLAVEHALAELVRELVHGDALVVVVGAEWLIAVSMLAVVGVVEVSLATELMARLPDPLAPGHRASATHRRPISPARVEAARAVRALSHALVGRDADDGALEEVTELAREARARLETAPRLPRAAAEFPSVRRSLDAPEEPTTHALADRGVTGPANPMAVDLVNRVVEGGIEAEAVFGAAFEGAPGRVHGGMVAAVFDDVLGAAMAQLGNPGYTGWITVHFRAPIPIEHPVRIRTWVGERDGRKVRVHGDLRLEGDAPVLAEAEGLMILVDADAVRMHADDPATADDVDDPADDDDDGSS